MKNQLVDVLLQLQLGRLEEIDMCNIFFIIEASDIGEEGVKRFFDNDWPALKHIRLSKLF